MVLNRLVIYINYATPLSEYSKKSTKKVLSEKVWNLNGGYVINRSLNDRLEKRNFSSCVEKCFACSLC